MGNWRISTHRYLLRSLYYQVAGVDPTMSEDLASANYRNKALQEKLDQALAKIRDIRRIAEDMRSAGFQDRAVQKYATMILGTTQEWGKR